MMFQLRGNEIEVKDKQFGNVRRMSWKNNRFRRACMCLHGICVSLVICLHSTVSFVVLVNREQWVFSAKLNLMRVEMSSEFN